MDTKGVVASTGAKPEAMRKKRGGWYNGGERSDRPGAHPNAGGSTLPRAARRFGGADVFAAKAAVLAARGPPSAAAAALGRVAAVRVDNPHARGAAVALDPAAQRRRAAAGRRRGRGGAGRRERRSRRRGRNRLEHLLERLLRGVAHAHVQRVAELRVRRARPGLRLADGRRVHAAARPLERGITRVLANVADRLERLHVLWQIERMALTACTFGGKCSGSP